jgi:hypothetical protein
MSRPISLAVSTEWRFLGAARDPGGRGAKKIGILWPRMLMEFRSLRLAKLCRGREDLEGIRNWVGASFVMFSLITKFVLT